MYADCGFPATSVDHAWMDQGRPTWLIDHEHPLLVIGYADGVLRVRAWRFEFGSRDITPLRVVEAQGHRKVDEAVKILLTANSGEGRLAMKSGFFESAPIGS